jgi:hypothetical protein
MWTGARMITKPYAALKRLSSTSVLASQKLLFGPRARLTGESQRQRTGVSGPHEP